MADTKDTKGVIADEQNPDALDAGLAAAFGLTANFRLSEKPGTVIGRYKLLQEIGEGGFGVVYMAEQTEPVRRKVALKIIKPGMDTKEVVARFEAERQALALMDHPNIAKVHDAGTTSEVRDQKSEIREEELERSALSSDLCPLTTGSGRPYFVMELVKGVPLTEYCDKNHLPARDRLELFIDVCHAIQHAHQKGIIHRDIKPSNIMVTLHDGKPVPKVIDFGVSKALSQQLTEKTLFTAYSQMIGTPAYMPPEQAELSGLDIDTRSDIYSLGVLLYELLTGSTPFDGKRLKSAGYAEMQRIIREEDPPRPSTRLTAIGEDTAVVSENRSTDPKKLGQFIRGDLDWIVMKALEKDRNRRFETANSFAADISRFLNDEPVEACPPSATYRFKKFARRNKAAFTTAAMVATALVFGIIGTAWQAVRAGTERDRANRERDTAQIQRNNAVDAKQLAVEQLQRTLKAEKLAAERLKQNRIQLANTELDQAQQLCESGDISSGLLRMANCLEIAPSAATELHRVIRMNLSAWSGRIHPLRMILQHPSGIECVAYSRDGSRVLTGGFQRVRVWDAVTGRMLGELDGLEDIVSAVDFSHDGKQILAASGNFARLWDAITLHPIGKPMQHEKKIQDAAFSPDGSRVLTGSSDKTARLWEATTGKPVGETMQHDHVVTSVGFSPDGKQLITGSYDKTARVWDADSTKQIGEPLKHFAPVREAMFSPDGLKIFIGVEGSGTVTEWDVQTRTRITDLFRAPGVIWKLASSPDGARLLSAGVFGTSAEVFDAKSGESVGGPFRYTDRIRGVAFSPDGERMLTGSLDGTARLWGTPADQQIGRPLSGGAGVNYSPKISSDGTLAVMGTVGYARLFDLKTGRKIGSRIVPNPRNRRNRITALAFNSDASRLLIGNMIGSVLLWDVAKQKVIGKPLQNAGPGERRIISLTFSPDGIHALAGGWEKTVRQWNIETRQLVGKPLPHEKRVSAVAYSGDGSQILTGDEGGNVRRWDAATGELLGTVLKGQGVIATISRDGKFILSRSADGVARLWDASTGRAIGKPVQSRSGQQQSMPMRGDALSRDGTRLLLNGKMWDIATGKQVGPPLPKQGVAAFTPDGSQVLIFGGRAVQLFDVNNSLVEEKAKQIKLWTQTITGMELDEGGIARLLTPQQWHQRHSRLSELGGPPQIPKTNTNRLMTAVEQGIRDAQAGLLEKATSEFATALELGADDAWLAVRIERRRNENHRRYTDLNPDLKFLPQWKSANQPLSQFLEKLAKDFPNQSGFQEAVADLLLSSGLNYNYPPLERAGRLQKAATAYEALANRFPDQPTYKEAVIRCVMELGRAFTSAESFVDAEQSFRNAIKLQNDLIELFPDNMEYQKSLANCHGHFGNMLARQDRFLDAEKEIKAGLRIIDAAITSLKWKVSPSFPEKQSELLTRLASLFTAGGRYQEAFDTVNKALKTEPRAGTHQSLSRFLLECPDPKFINPAGALKHAHKANLLVPYPILGIRRNLGFAYFATGDWENATRVLEDVIKTFESTDPEIGFRLAITSAKQDQRIEGIHWYSMAVLWTREWESDKKRSKRLESQK
jgi:WD40 repeat protein/serine/threonine protein kinase/tetratricopeptide (TPR) repeat protein